mgnify:CR=1 FL=1
MKDLFDIGGKPITGGFRQVVSWTTWPGTGMQLLAIALAGVLGLLLMRPAADAPHEPMSVPVSRTAGAAWLALFFALLLSLPLLLQAMPSQALALVDAFYRAGALVFGGGHVVLPLLQASVVPPGWVSSDAFLAGYGAAQAVPGPLFTFAAYLGAAAQGWAGVAQPFMSLRDNHTEPGWYHEPSKRTKKSISLASGPTSTRR